MDTSVYLHGDKYFALASKVTLPKMSVGGFAADSHGKFIFWDSTGLRGYVIVQADASAGFINDYGVYTLAPDFTPGCPVTLGINSATAIGYPDVGSVTVSAAADCVWEAKTTAPWIQIDTGTLGAGVGNVGYSVLPNGGSTPRTGTITIGTQTFTVTQSAGSVGAPQASTPPSPASGTGNTQTFTFTVSDPKGAASINIVNLLINTAIDGRGACYLAYVQPTNTLALTDDAGALLIDSMILNGGSRSVSNGQCTVSAAGSSAVSSGNTLTLTLNITFRPGFAGNKVLYLAGRELDETTSGWRAVGTWNVPTTIPPTGTSVTSITPASAAPASGTTVSYTLTLNDTNGWQDLGVVNVLINDALDGTHACYLAFTPATGLVYLVNDAGNALIPGSASISPASSVQNSQCQVTPTGLIGSGSSLTLTFNAGFLPAFAGNRLVYVAARSNGVLNSGWQAMGSVQPR